MELIQTTPEKEAANPQSADRSHVPNVSSARGTLRIALFFLFAGSVLVAADRLVNAGLRRIQTGSFGASNRIVNGQINAEILITGSSRALTHYDPRIIEAATGHSTYNIGINGSQTDMQVAVLKTYLRHNRPPKLLIHNLDLYAFQTTKEIYDPAQYLPYLQERPIYEAIHRIYPDAWKWKWLPFYGFATTDFRFSWLLGLRGLVGAHPLETHIQGFTPRYSSWTGDFEKLRDIHPEGVTFDIEQRGVSDLSEIVQIAGKLEIPVLFVYSPEYVEMQTLERNRREIFQKFEEVAAPSQTPLWDYSASAISQSRDLFYNSQHLNAAGADAFSRDVAFRLQNTKLRGFSE